jgi:hypothetical protein
LLSEERLTIAQLEELRARVDRLEKRDVEELLTVIEIMSNVTFFGEMKRADCEFSKDGQCSLYFLKNEAKGKIPLATECRIPKCAAAGEHCHLEASNITCTFCPRRSAVNTGQFLREKILERDSR